jgi:ribosomal protein S18 acetylase RimI-like enzyme
MGVTYFKRFRMEVLLESAPAPPPLPKRFYWVPWHDSMVEYHAQVKHRCFENELDATIFPCLGNFTGCEQLMLDISSRRGFLPAATWLIGTETGYVATVQGVIDRYNVGMIQNLGVVPEARGLGLGTALLLKALEGFRNSGMRLGTLEVTAQNTSALRIYRRVGFRRARTLYKAVEVP